MPKQSFCIKMAQAWVVYYVCSSREKIYFKGWWLKSDIAAIYDRHFQKKQEIKVIKIQSVSSYSLGTLIGCIWPHLCRDSVIAWLHGQILIGHWLTNQNVQNMKKYWELMELENEIFFVSAILIFFFQIFFFFASSQWK